MSQSPTTGYGYNGYGYELQQLLNRYGVSSPVAPRQQSGQTDDDYRLQLGEYGRSVQSTPMYDMPTGNATYQDLTKNVLYGNPTDYFASRGITNPNEMWRASDVFGWSPRQVGQQTSTRSPITAYAPPQVNQPAQLPMTGAKSYNPADSSTWSPEELAYAKGWSPTFSGPQEPQAQQSQDWWNTGNALNIDLGDDYMSDVQNYADQARAGGFDGGETNTLFTLAGRYGINPGQMASLLGSNSDGTAITEQDVVNHLKQTRPHDAYNYLTQAGHGYAEGGAVTDDVDLQELLNRYATMGAERDTEVEEARTRSREANTKVRTAIDQMLAQPADTPSRAELWWKLAAAFAQPGQTGSFSEGLGNAATAVGSHKAEERAVLTADRLAKQRLGIEALSTDASQARSELDTARLLSGQANSTLGTLLQASRPRSAAGQQALDEGLEPGTPEYESRVNEINSRPDEAQDLRERLADMQAQRDAAAAEARRASQGRMSAAETKMLADSEDLIVSGESALVDLRKALELNPNTYDASMLERGQYLALSAVGSEDPKVVNTREQENLLANQALEKLKLTFGGAPTEGERAILLDLQGIGAKTKLERGRIITRSIEALNRRLEAQRKRLEDIRAGAYRNYQLENPDAP